MPPSQWQLLSLLAVCLSQASTGTYIITEGFAQYLLDTSRLTKRYTGSLETGRSYLLPLDLRPPVLLVLRSLHGDADLYVSGGGRTPSPVDYELKSENFSVDLVFIPDEMKPPIGALIYATPQCSENATYMLDVYRHESLLDEYAIIRDELDSRWDPPDETFVHSRTSQSPASRSSGASGGSSSQGGSEADSSGSFLYNLVTQLGRLLLFILEVAVDN